MTAAHVQTHDQQTGSGTTVTVTLTSVVAGNHLTATTQCFHPVATSMLIASSTPAATWHNVTNLGNINQTGGGIGGAQQGLRIDYTENVAAGSWSVVMNGNSGASITGHVTESSGVATTASIGVSSSGSSGASNVASQAAGSITPTAGSILIAGWVSSSGNTAAPSADNSFILRSDSTGYSGNNERAGQFSKDNVAATPVNVTISESSSTAQMISAVVEFLAAAGGVVALPPGLGPSLEMNPTLTSTIGW